MCGIFGIVTKKEELLGPILIEAGRRLSYRGYDSVGCATIGPYNIELRKDVGKIDEVAERLKFEELSGNRGIIQLRWATFGSPSPENAQPHIDSDGDLIGAHNGNVVNNIELRQQFIDEGMVVRSENDGETCVHAVERYVNRGLGLFDAIRNAYLDLEGDYAFIIGKVGDDKLYSVKKGSGLVIGIADGATCVSSDLPSILPLTRKIKRVHDGEIVILSHNQVEIRRIENGDPVERDFEIISDSMESTQKGGYPHFMLKEIHEQPVVADELLRLLENSPEVLQIIEKMNAARHLYLIGCGTSYHACILGSLYLSSIAGVSSIPVLAPQFIAQYGSSVTANDLGIFVSQSGETKDILNALEVAQRKGMGAIGLVNVIGSTLMRTTEHYLPLACGYEISVPATKTFLNQVIALLFLSLQMADFPTESLHLVPKLMNHTIDMVDLQIDETLPFLRDWNDLYCLGYGSTYPIALEGALKLKEITYSHCEGMLSTEFKHGPLSAVIDDYPIIFVANQQDSHLIVSGINEVTCRGGRAIVISAEDNSLRTNASNFIQLPESGSIINPILSIIPLQLIAYKMSVQRGYNPDFPRNLSKTLTVD